MAQFPYAPLSSNRSPSRRHFLRLCAAGVAVSIAGGLLAACGGSASVSASTSAAPTSATTHATSAAPASSATTSSAAASQIATATTSAATTTSTAKATSAASASVAPAAGLLQLSLWTTWGDKDQVAEQAMADSFTKQHSGVTVTVQTVPDGDKFTAAMASGNPPDLLQTWNAARIATYAMSGGVALLDSFIAASKMDLTKLDTAGLDAGRLFGKQYGMPMLVYTNTLLFWNKSLFQTVGLDPDTAPATWQELTTAATKFNTKQGGNFTRLGFVPNNGQGGVSNIMWSFGGQLYSADGKAVTPDNPGVVKCAQFGRDQIVQFGGIDAINAFKKGFGTNENDPFYIGQIVMQINGEWVPTFIAKYKPSLDYGIGFMPYDEAALQAKQSGNIGTNLIVIPKDGKHQQDAWNVIAFANTPEPNLALAKALGNTPQVLEAAKTMGEQASTPQLKFIVQAHMSRNMKSTQINPVSSDYNSELSKAIGTIMDGKQDAQAALSQVKAVIQPKLDALLKQG